MLIEYSLPNLRKFPNSFALELLEKEEINVRDYLVCVLDYSIILQ